MPKILWVLTAVLLAACSSGGDADSAAPSKPPVPPLAPPAPFAPYGTLSALEMQLLGPDSNANGVRDDVDAVIANTYSDTVQRQRATVYATWLTWATLRGARATASSSAELTSFSNAVACAYETRIAALGGTADGQDALYGTVLNTVERTRAYLTWDASTSGTPSVMDMQPCSHLSEVPSP